MKIALISIALTLGVSASQLPSLSSLKEKGKAAVTAKVAPQVAKAKQAKESIKAAPSKAKEAAKAKAAEKKAATTAKVNEKKAAVTATVTEKKNAVTATIEEKKDAATTAVTGAVTGAAAGALLGSADSTTASAVGSALAGAAGSDSTVLSALQTKAKDALASKFTSQQTLLSQLSSLKSGETTSASSLEQLKSAAENYQKANQAWSLVEGQLSDTQASAVKSFFPTSDSLDSSIMTQAASLLLQKDESSTPGVLDVLQTLAK